MTMKKIEAAVLGCGSRGWVYTMLMGNQNEKFEITALCDVNLEQLEKMHHTLGLPNAEDFLDEEKFWEKRRGDILVIATDDREHVRQAVRAMEMGYHILLEKPISDDREELQQLMETQAKTGKHVIVCHELRYAFGYKKCYELIQSGVIGDLIMIDATERPFYWHWAQAYVRGIGASLELGHPAILAKCSHDLDLIQWYVGSPCDTVSSVGGLKTFRPENAPEGAAERCVDCKYQDTCPYSAKKIYIDGWHKAGEPAWQWPWTKVSIKQPLKEEDLYEGIREGVYGRCAYKCTVEKVDHQIVQMTFENGVKATHSMIFSAEGGRRYAFYGTNGEIIMDERTDDITVMPYGKEREVIQIGVAGDGHGGGDKYLIGELYDAITGVEKARTSLKNSVECHLIGISAEESRKQNGALIKVHQ